MIPSQNYADYAVNFFFSSYIFIRTDLQDQSFMDCLYPAWVQTSLDSTLRPALAAVGSCLLEAWVQLKEDVPLSLSRGHYVEAVAALRTCMQDRQNIGDDAILAALLLDMYENLVAFFLGKSNTSPHPNGVATMVEHWRQQPRTSELSQRVLLGARKHIVNRAIQTRQPVPFNASTWNSMVQNVPQTTSDRLDELNIEVARLQAIAQPFKTDNKFEEDHLLDFLREAFELDGQLSSWLESIPENWTPSRVSGPDCIPQSVTDAGLYQPYCYVYKSVYVAFNTNSYLISRIKLQLAIRDCLKHLHNDMSETASANALNIIQDSADTICASVPFHLGDKVHIKRIDDKSIQYPHLPGQSVPDEHHAAAAAHGGWFTASRLATLLAPDVPLREGQRMWIMGQLGRVARVYALHPIEEATLR
jgi:hypothetical protein